jgi:hypothetical protein
MLTMPATTAISRIVRSTGLSMVGEEEAGATN